MRGSDRLVLASAVAVLLIGFTARPLTADSSYLGQSWLVVLVLAALTAGLRRARLGAGAVLAAQLVGLAVLLPVLASFAPGRGDSWYPSYLALWRQGLEHMQHQSAPMEPDAGVKVIFVSVIGLVFVLTDLLVSGLERPAWAIVPLAAAFVVPGVGLGIDVGFPMFACLALGYLGILVADGLNRTARWTRGLSRDSAEGFGTATPVVWRAAGLIGGPALVVTAVLGLILPTLALPGIGIGRGGTGNAQLRLTDPTLDLRRNLNQAEDTVVIRYRSDRPGGLHLRMASLPIFDAGGWRNVDMRLEGGTRLSAIPGVSTETGPRRTTDISVLDFRSEYLPLPYAPRTVDVTGDWAFDPYSLTVLSTAAADREDAIRDLDYTATSVDVDPDPRGLARAAAGAPADRGITAQPPPDLPEDLVALTRQVTKDADTPAAKAWAIQGFLRGPDFTYSTEPLPGSGYQALENFLLRDRRGYCEQFAASMAMMAREVGIPSRVAVGFLPGSRLADNTWEVSIRDMHAWPELYFAGYGWVRFEPTPASLTGTPPAWTVTQSQSSTAEESLNPTALPSASLPSGSEAPSAAPSQGPAEVDDGAQITGLGLLVGTGIGLVVLAVLAAPAAIRYRRRVRRLAMDRAPAEAVEDVWAELRDTVVDFGGTWPQGSPRTIGAAVGGKLEPGESAAMGRVALLVERGRYARSLDADGLEELPTATRQIRRGLAPRSRWRRVKATVLPRSVLRRHR